MNQKGFANIALIILIVILVSAGGYFAFVKKSGPITQQTPTPQTSTPPATQTQNDNSQTTTTQEQTASWKTYRDEEWGLEIKYPPEWLVEKPAHSYMYFRNASSSSFFQEQFRIGFVTEMMTSNSIRQSYPHIQFQSITVSGYPTLVGEGWVDASRYALIAIVQLQKRTFIFIREPRAPEGSKPDRPGSSLLVPNPGSEDKRILNLILQSAKFTLSP